MTAGNDIYIFYKPKSTSLVTIAYFSLSFNSSTDANVEQGISNNDERI